MCLGVGVWVNNLRNRLTSTILETSLFAFSKHQNLNWSNGLSTSLYYKPTDLHSYLAVVFIFPFITSQEFHTFFSISDFVLYVVMTLIFPKNHMQCASFSINVAILFLSFKWAIIVPNKLIDSQHYKWLRRKTLFTFHWTLPNFTLTTTQLNL